MRVLLVEDDRELGEALVVGMRRQKFAVDWVTTIGDAWDLLASVSYDVAVFDVGLPDGSGIDLCRDVCESESLLRPSRILMLTARSAVESRVSGLDAGADDYMVKPFDFAELAARLRALSRRSDRPGAVAEIGDLEIDMLSHRVRRGDRALSLTGKEFAVLRYLVLRVNEVVSTEDLLEHCWDMNADSFTSSVRVILSRLRRKLGDPPLIETVVGVGYRLSSE